MPKITVTCGTCEGRKIVPTSVEDGHHRIGDCPACGGTALVEAELEPGLKATLLSGPDYYPFVVTRVFSPTHLGLLGGDAIPTDGRLRIVREITLRSDGVWRERGHRKSSGGRFVLGYAASHRSREV